MKAHPLNLSRVGLLLFLTLTIGGCLTIHSTGVVPSIVSSIDEYQPYWTPLFDGIDYARARMLEPMPQAVYAVRVDLENPNIRFLVTPCNGDGTGCTRGRKTSTFLNDFHCQLAINASPFSPVQEDEGTPIEIQGLSISCGDAYSAARDDRGALLISEDNKVLISYPPYDGLDAHNAVGGFGMVLDDGRNVGEDSPRHPRTAAGVSEDGRYLYLLLVDGRQAKYSIGITTAECGEWLKQLGAYDAVNLDGGGSTTLVISDKAGKAILLNKPIHKGIPKQERVNGNHLGIYAAPVTKGIQWQNAMW